MTTDRDREEPPRRRPSKPEQDLRLPGRRTREAIEESESRGSVVIAVILGVVLVGAGGIALRVFTKPDPNDDTVASSASAEASASSNALAPVGSRCAPAPGTEVFTVGDPKPSADAGAGGGKTAEETDLAPYAAILGRGVPTKGGGFALGALHDGDGGTIVSVVCVDASGAGSIVKLERSRGDLEPPVVTEMGDALAAVVLEPNAGGLALKLVRVDGDKVEWGAELDQKDGESLATDLAIGQARGVVVWDEVRDDVSRVMMASFKPPDVGTLTAPRAITDAKAEADAPRLITRSGGFYVVFKVRGAEIDHPDKDHDPPKDRRDDEVDESRGERVYASWLEALSLDENGSPTGSSVELTPRDGRVSGFDVAASADGFVVAWRNEDAPSGGAGGDVRVMKVVASGPLESTNLSNDGAGGAAPVAQAVATGAPSLVGSFIAVPSLRGPALLAHLDADAHPSSHLLVEPGFGLGEPLAAAADRVLVARPHGRAVDLAILSCDEK